MPPQGDIVFGVFVFVLQKHLTVILFFFYSLLLNYWAASATQCSLVCSFVSWSASCHIIMHVVQNIVQELLTSCILRFYVIHCKSNVAVKSKQCSS